MMYRRTQMAELAPADRLQPSLLDRLTDLEPEKNVESRDRRVISAQGLREAVLRDLAWLLNTTNLSAVQDLDAYPEVIRSVTNFGVPDLAGLTSRSIDTSALARLVKQAIVDFEPRLLSATLKVRVEANSQEMSGNALVFFIEGHLWAEPSPIALYLKTEVDLETHNATIVEDGR